MESTIEEVTRLKTGTVEQKLAVIDGLVAKGGSGSINLLIEALSDQKWVVRKQASDCLAKFGPTVIEQLGKVLASGDEDQRFWVVKSLVTLGRDSLPLLCRALTKGSKFMRIYAASALGDIGDEMAIPLLVNGLGDQVWRVRRNCYQALVSFGDKALPALEKAMSSDNEDVLYWSARALGKIGESSRDILLKALKTGTEQSKFVVAAALAETGDTRIIAVLVRNCGEGNWILQKRSAEALGDIGRVAVPAIIESLKSATGRKLYWLLYALAHMDAYGLQAIEKVLVKGGETFRWNVKDHIAEIGEAVIPVLENLAANDDKNVRFYAVTCLGEAARTGSADDVLMSALADASWSIRRVAADALAVRGAAVLDRLNLALETGDEDLRYWVTYIFRKMGSVGISYLIRALGDSNKNIAYFAASALGDVHDEEVIRPLVRALGDEYWPVRRNAADSLRRLARFAISTLINHINDENTDIQYWVMRILKDVGSQHLEEIITKLKKGNDEERLFAAKAIGAIKDPRAVEPLIAALTDGHDWVRLYAAIALGEIGDRRALTHLISILGEPGFKTSPAIYKIFDRFGEAAVPELISVADEDKNIRRRCAAMAILGHLKSETAFDKLMAGLKSQDQDIRAACVEAVANYGSRPEVLPALEQVLKNTSTKLRGRVIQALAAIGTEDVIRPLLMALHKGQLGRDGKDGVLNVLTELGDKALPKLIELLGSKQVGLRKASAEALVSIGPSVQSEVERAAKSDDANVRFWAARVLKGLREGKLSE